MKNQISFCKIYNNVGFLKKEGDHVIWVNWIDSDNFDEYSAVELVNANLDLQDSQIKRYIAFEF